MTDRMRVFVNATPVEVAAGTSVRGAIEALDAELASQAAAGAALVTDARGIALPLDGRLEAGSILRVIVRAGRGDRGADADA